MNPSSTLSSNGTSLHRYFLDALWLIEHNYQPSGSELVLRSEYLSEQSFEARAKQLKDRVDLMSPVSDQVVENAPKLERMMAALEQSEAQVCVVVYPVSPDYASAMELNPRIQRSARTLCIAVAEIRCTVCRSLPCSDESRLPVQPGSSQYQRQRSADSNPVTGMLRVVPDQEG